MATTTDEAPFSARYSLPVQVSENLQDVSWETVVQLSSDFQARSHDKSGKVKKAIKELQMGRLLLMDKIRHTPEGEKIDPQLLVHAVRLLQRSEEIAQQYDVDLREFSKFLFLISEKLKKEKLAHYHGHAHMGLMSPIKEGLAHMQSKGWIRSKAPPRKAKPKAKK
ncbi:Uncharacterised protein [uncultured archaeon]|nr:Uncharacterised protein [uncultured archaeon]